MTDSTPPNDADPRSPQRLLRWAVGLVLAFTAAGTIWLVSAALLNPDVRLRRPRWVEGAFDLSFWVPLTLTFTLGALAVALVLWTALRRMRAGEDIHANSFRARKWRELEERMREAKGERPA